MNAALERQLKNLKKDPKKLMLMLGLGAVMILLWGRLLWQRIPRTAVAEPIAVAVVPAADQKEISSVSQQGVLVRKTIYVDLVSLPRRDLFAFDPSDYKKLKEEHSAQPEKLAPQQPDKQEQEERQLRSLLRGVVLESTMVGRRPCAVIDGQIIEPGQTIHGMTLISVQPRQVILKYKNRRIRLRM